MLNLQNISLNILTDISIAVCLIGSTYLLIRGKNNRARRMLGYALLMWGLCSVARIICLYAGLLPLLLHPMRPVGLIGANLFVVFLFFFPLEVMLPGWLNVRRFFGMLVPVVVLTIIYKIGLFITGEETEELNYFSDFVASFTHFNVWFRLTFLLLVIFYNVLMMRLVYHNEKKYIRWKNNNYADEEYMDMSWMRFYAIGSMLIFVAWLPNILVAEVGNFITHTAVTIICFSYFIYKGLFYESAYPEDYFKDAEGNIIAQSFVPGEEIIPCECAEDTEGSTSNDSFEARVPQYVETFKTWMDKEKPYMYKDFKLTDVSRVLPLNRSYLSRVLNEGLGMNFCQVVRKYRIEEARKILVSTPDLPIYLVAEQCGFSSDTTFIRAFQQEMKVTPSLYRTQNCKQN